MHNVSDYYCAGNCCIFNHENRKNMKTKKLLEQKLTVVELKRTIRAAIVKQYGSLHEFRKVLSPEKTKEFGPNIANYLTDSGAINYSFLKNIAQELKIGEIKKKEVILTLQVFS